MFTGSQETARSLWTEIGIFSRPEWDIMWMLCVDNSLLFGFGSSTCNYRYGIKKKRAGEKTVRISLTHACIIQIKYCPDLMCLDCPS